MLEAVYIAVMFALIVLNLYTAKVNLANPSVPVWVAALSYFATFWCAAVIGIMLFSVTL